MTGLKGLLGAVKSKELVAGNKLLKTGFGRSKIGNKLVTTALENPGMATGGAGVLGLLALSHLAGKTADQSRQTSQY